MSYSNYNLLYYFWQVCQQESMVSAAELFLTPQLITGQIQALEERLQGKLFRRQGREVMRRGPSVVSLLS